VVLFKDNAGIVSWNKPRQPLPHLFRHKRN